MTTLNSYLVLVEMNNSRKIVYKKVKIPMPHCNVCGEMLGGNGSGFSPYRCKCGVWGYEHDWRDFSKFGHFIMKPNKEKGDDVKPE